jgi:hypothetical protein
MPELLLAPRVFAVAIPTPARLKSGQAEDFSLKPTDGNALQGWLQFINRQCRVELHQNLAKCIAGLLPGGCNAIHPTDAILLLFKVQIVSGDAGRLAPAPLRNACVCNGSYTGICVLFPGHSSASCAKMSLRFRHLLDHGTSWHRCCDVSRR